MISDLDEWTVMQKVKQEYTDYEEYQKVNQKAIDELYAQLRVREVHYRGKSSSSIRSITQEDKIITTIGYNSKTDEPV